MKCFFGHDWIFSDFKKYIRHYTFFGKNEKAYDYFTRTCAKCGRVESRKNTDLNWVRVK